MAENQWGGYLDQLMTVGTDIGTKLLAEEFADGKSGKDAQTTRADPNPAVQSVGYPAITGTGIMIASGIVLVVAILIFVFKGGK